MADALTDHSTMQNSPAADRIETIGGEVLGRAPMSPRHVAVLANLLNQVRTIPLTQALFAVHSTLVLDPDNKPRPDLMLLRPRQDFYKSDPTAADVLLVVEISESPVAYEVPMKAPLYARLALPEYWIIDLEKNAILAWRNGIEAEHTGSDRITGSVLGICPNDILK